MTAGARPADEAHFAAESLWIRRAVRRDPVLRLICFPYAGAGASVFRGWPLLLPPSIEVIAVQLPGREDRARECPPDSIGPLIRHCAIALRPYLTMPFAFYGHCAGALLAYEVAHDLGARLGTWPLRLVAGAQQAPDLARFERLHELPDSDLMSAVGRRGGVPQAVLDNPELCAFLLPLVRADFTVWERYRYQPRPPLRCPVTAVLGAADLLVAAPDAAAWAVHTSAGSDLLEVPGGHYFINGLTEEAAAVLTRALLADHRSD